jgi:plasmid stabilization system protein ParE
VKRRVITLPRALADMLRNADWWARNRSFDEAADWFDAVQTQSESLAESADTYALSDEGDEFPLELRENFVGMGRRKGYRAVFTIRGDTVFVLTIRRFAQSRLTLGDIDVPT